MPSRRPMTNMKTPSQVNENYACATHSSLPAGRFHSDKRVVVWRLHDTDAGIFDIDGHTAVF